MKPQEPKVVVLNTKVSSTARDRLHALAGAVRMDVKDVVEQLILGADVHELAKKYGREPILFT